MCEWGKSRKRGRERIPSRLRTVSTGLDLTNHEIMTSAKVKSQMLNGLSHPFPYTGNTFIMDPYTRPQSINIMLKEVYFIQPSPLSKLRGGTQMCIKQTNDGMNTKIKHRMQFQHIRGRKLKFLYKQCGEFNQRGLHISAPGELMK